ncbi:N-acetylglucosamine kinase [Bacillota bacterium Meth-B3]
MSAETWIVGIDAGGTRTRAALYDKEGNLHAEAQGGYGSMLVDPRAAMEHIGDVTEECLRGAGPNARIYVGAAGIYAGDNRQRLTAYLCRRFAQAAVRVEDDALMALYAITHGADSILVIAGTGSIAYGKRADRICRRGGWGNILGDEGSGYDICRKALVQITQDYDGGGAYRALSREILSSLDTDVWGVVKWVHTAPKGEIAALLPLINRMAAAGDLLALALLREAGRSLATLTEKLYARMGFDGRVLVAVKGGVLEKIPTVLTEFARNLPTSRFHVRSQSAPSERGAFYLYLEETQNAK